MADVVNLRTARKQAQRLKDAKDADEQRLIHGRRKHLRELTAARRERENRNLDGHKLTTGDKQ